MNLRGMGVWEDMEGEEEGRNSINTMVIYEILNKGVWR